YHDCLHVMISNATSSRGLISKRERHGREYSAGTPTAYPSGLLSLREGPPACLFTILFECLHALNSVHRVPD
ncbi:hypothetical protein BDW69DRAFT_169460, partial [Aspergillus filifer]